MILQHACVTVCSVDAAVAVFEDLFEMPLLYTFPISTEIIDALFKIRGTADARVYDAGNSQIEVFIMADPPAPGRTQHICLGFPDRELIVSRAESMGFEIRKFKRPDAEVLFIIDNDGNLFEIKNV